MQGKGNKEIQGDVRESTWKERGGRRFSEGDSESRILSNGVLVGSGLPLKKDIYPAIEFK